MSTNPKNVNSEESSETTMRSSKRSVDANLRALHKEMEQENTLVQETPVGRLYRVLKIYRGHRRSKALRAETQRSKKSSRPAPLS